MATNIPTLEQIQALKEDTTPAGREKFFQAVANFTENADKFANEKMAELKGDPVVASKTSIQRSSAQLDNIEANLEATLRHVRAANAALRSTGRRPWWARFLCC